MVTTWSRGVKASRSRWEWLGIFEFAPIGSEIKVTAVGCYSQREWQVTITPCLGVTSASGRT
jgi:hypothetical protein